MGKPPLTVSFSTDSFVRLILHRTHLSGPYASLSAAHYELKSAWPRSDLAIFDTPRRHNVDAVLQCFTLRDPRTETRRRSNSCPTTANQVENQNYCRNNKQQVN